MEMVFDIRSIMQNLPHRYPFLLVDRVIEFVKNERIVALKNVTINEPFFQGHFPDPHHARRSDCRSHGASRRCSGHPITSAGKSRQVIYFMGFDKVRFRKPVVPGDQLILELEMLETEIQSRKNGRCCQGRRKNCRRSKVDGRLWRLI
jgi:3-hydroxyacyl-[acyl-carrier-protein] dehydratase